MFIDYSNNIINICRFLLLLLLLFILLLLLFYLCYYYHYYYYYYYYYYCYFLYLLSFIIIINGKAPSETFNNIYSKQPTSYLQVTASWLLKIKIKS